MLGIVWLAALAMAQVPSAPGQVSSDAVASFRAPGFAEPVWGRWLEADDRSAGMPLGGLGVGAIQVGPGGRLTDAPADRSCLGPPALGACQLTVRIGSGAPATLLASDRAKTSARSARFFGHFPVADLDYGLVDGASIWVRVFAPLAPCDSDLSNTPAALFSVRLTNPTASLLTVSVSLRWSHAAAASPSSRTAAPGPALPAEQPVCGVRLGVPGPRGSAALGAMGGAADVRVMAREAADGAGEVEGSFALRPGQSRRVTFAYAWHTPASPGADGRVRLNRYAVRFADAWAVASSALHGAVAMEERIASWQSEIYRRSLPGWLKDALINSLAAWCRGTTWSESGRLDPARGAGDPGDSLPLAILFPAVEAADVRARAEQAVRPGGAPPAGLAAYAFVLRCRRACRLDPSPEFARAVLPAVERAVRSAAARDSSGDGLITDPGRTRWPWYGATAQGALLQMAGLRAAGEIGAAASEAGFAAWCRECAERVRRAVDDALWTGRHYRLFSDFEHGRVSESVLANQLAGPLHAWLAGCSDVMGDERATAVVRSIGELNGQATRWGAVAAARPDGSADDGGGLLSAGVVPADVWEYASAALWAAARTEDPALRRAALGTAERTYRALLLTGTLWDPSAVYGAGDGQPVTAAGYAPVAGVWALPFSLAQSAVGPPPRP